MNKIIIDKDKDLLLDKEEYEIEIINNSNINIFINNKEVKIILLIKNSNVNIDLIVNKDNKLTINSLGIDSSINYNINIKDNSNILIVDSIMSKIDSLNKIKLINEGNNSITKFYTNGINLSNNKMFFYIDGIISKNCLNVYLEENSKIINNKNGDSKIIPNLIVDTKEVIANHSAYIGTISKDTLLYLISRGIEKKEAKKILMKFILLANMNLNTDKFIKEISLNMERGDFYE